MHIDRMYDKRKENPEAKHISAYFGVLYNVLLSRIEPSLFYGLIRLFVTYEIPMQPYAEMKREPTCRSK